MGMFLWAVGSFYMFGETWALTSVLQLKFNLFQKTHMSMYIVYLQRSIMPKFGKAYFFEIPIGERLLFFRDSNFVNSAFKLISVDLGGLHGFPGFEVCSLWRP